MSPEEAEEINIRLNRKKFQSQRRLAGASLFGIGAILVVAVFWVKPENMEHYAALFSSAIFSFTGIVAVFMGSTAWVEK